MEFLNEPDEPHPAILFQLFNIYTLLQMPNDY